MLTCFAIEKQKKKADFKGGSVRDYVYQVLFYRHSRTPYVGPLHDSIAVKLSVLISNTE